ncbi:energy transducer TonB [Bacteroides thetaiotaomicron]
MLNRKRTHNIMVGKYLMFIPVAALLLLFSNCANKKTDKVQSDTEKADTVVAAEPDKPAEPQVEVAITETKGDSIYSVVETMPDFPGGQKELLSFLSRNIKYPTKAIESKIQGRVIVQFVVNKDGSISNAKIVRSVDPDLDKEALRVINSMPQWKPGMQKGEPVSVKYTVPIVFRNQQN